MTHRYCLSYAHAATAALRWMKTPLYPPLYERGAEECCRVTLR